MKVEPQKQVVKTCEDEELMQLVKKAAEGDRAALHVLCERLGASVLFRAKCMLNREMSEMDAEDLAQEIFSRICENITTLREPKAFRKWLSVIIATEAERFLRKSARRGVTLNIEDYAESIIEENGDYIPEECAKNSEMRAMVMDVLYKLPDRQRQTVIQYYYDELSVTEIAEVMNITQQGVSKNLSLAIRRIATELKKMPASASYGVMPVLAAGYLIRDVIQTEALNFVPQNPEWLQTVLEPCAQYFAAGSAVAGGASVATGATSCAATSVGTTTAAVVTVVTAFVCTLAIAAVMVFNTPTTEQKYIPLTGGGIIFSGGICLGENYKRINPESAMPCLDCHIRILEWWITAGESEIVLRCSEVNTVEEAFLRLYESAVNGVYRIIFRVEREVGTIYRVSNTFKIHTR